MSKFESSPVTREFQRQKRNHLNDPTICVIAGISGGPDSMAMLYLLHRFEIDTIAVHCNYQLRGAASDKDQKLVEQISEHWNIECVSLRFDSKKKSEGNFQEWARDRRYLAFRDLKEEYNARYILTAHHQDDQLETILQKILRGSGIGSWNAMEISDGDLLRPLLQLSKADIMDFVQEFNVPYRIDRTNEESTYARNFIRNHWFPDLNRLFPGWKNNLLKLPQRAEEFNKMVRLILGQVSKSGTELDRQKFLNLEPDIRGSILLQFLKNQVDYFEISKGFLENASSVEDLQTGKKIQISDDCYLIRDRSVFKVLFDNDFTSFQKTIKKTDLDNPIKINHIQLSLKPVSEKYSEDLLHLDHDKIHYPLELRRWQNGDSFQPLGLDGTQLVSDHLTNRKIPADLKKNALVLESFDGTICAVIFPNHSSSHQIGTISENVRCTHATQKSLIIKRLR